jgi:ATP-dependent exoDNAse (exonuclease V) alpha subunit
LNATDDRPAEYTSRDLIEAEKSLMRRALKLASRRRAAARFGALMPKALPPPLCEALSYAVAAGDFKAIGLLEEAHAEFLTAVRAYWQSQGRRVLEVAVPPDSKELSEEDVLVVGGAEMIDLKSLEGILASAERARAKLVLLADAAQLHAMGAMSAVYALMRVGRE